MLLSEKLKKSSKKEKDNLIGKKVKVNYLHVKGVEGKFRGLQSNGLASVYLDEFCRKDEYTKPSRWVKSPTSKIEVL